MLRLIVLSDPPFEGSYSGRIDAYVLLVLQLREVLCPPSLVQFREEHLVQLALSFVGDLWLAH